MDGVAALVRGVGPDCPIAVSPDTLNRIALLRELIEVLPEAVVALPRLLLVERVAARFGGEACEIERGPEDRDDGDEQQDDKDAAEFTHRASVR